MSSGKTRRVWVLPFVADMILVVLLSMPTIALCDWSHDPNENLAVCTAAGWQHACKLVSDGAGGAILVWEDDRTDQDIYAQRLDAQGNLMWWPADGVPVCAGAELEQVPEIVSDAAGGAIIVWKIDVDGMAENYSIRAQRVDAFGYTQWAPDGVPICALPGTRGELQMIADGVGGAVIAWSDERGLDTDIYAQRITGDGDALWTPDGREVCTAVGNQMRPHLATDKEGGAVIAWQDLRTGYGSDDIYAQRISAEGIPLWTPYGVAVCGAVGPQGAPRMISDNAGGVIIVWEDFRWTDVDVYAQRVSAWGTARWASDGVPVCAAAGRQQVPQLATDGTSGAIIAWDDQRSPGSGVYAQHIDRAGVARWTTDGIVAISSQWPALGVCVVEDGAGGALVTTASLVALDFDVYSQRLDAEGDVLWGDEGLEVSIALGDPLWLYGVSDGAGGIIVAWADPRSGNYNIYAQRVERNGYLGDPAPQITEVVDYPNDQGGSCIASWEPSYLDAYPHQVVTHYSVWRKYFGEESARGQAVPVGDDFAPAGVSAELLEQMLRSGWTYAGQVDACYLDEYGYDVPTYGDSTEAGVPMCGVMILAHTDDPWVSWQSVPGIGYSVDNLPPGAPFNLMAGREGSAVALEWGSPLEETEDLGFYAIYRSTEPGLIPLYRTRFSGHKGDLIMPPPGRRIPGPRWESGARVSR